MLKQQTIAIFGGLGFIGHNMVNELSKEYDIKIFDNNSNASRSSDHLDYYHGDARNIEDVEKFFNTYKIDIVINLIANADISISAIDRFVDFELSPKVNLNILSLSEKYDVKKYIYFSGSGVYGDPQSLEPLPEERATVDSASLYGSSKITCEAFCLAFSNTGKLSVGILRPGNIIGSGATHGLIYDILLKIKKTPNEIDVLGNGLQEKSYIHVSDVIEGVKVLINSKEKKNIFNIAAEDTIIVKEIIEEIVRQTNFGTKVNYGTENFGWIGDVPKYKLDCSALKKHGWSSKYKSKDAVIKAVFENLDLLK